MTIIHRNTMRLTLLLILVVVLVIPMQTVKGQTETPPAMIDYVDIDGTNLGIERVITLGDLGISIILLGILGMLMTYLAYRLVIDKLN